MSIHDAAPSVSRFSDAGIVENVRGVKLTNVRINGQARNEGITRGGPGVPAKEPRSVVARRILVKPHHRD
jgi:hypothetical protein